MLRVTYRLLAVVGFRVVGVVDDTFAVALQGAGLGACEGVKKAPFVDLVPDFTWDGEKVRHTDDNGDGNMDEMGTAMAITITVIDEDLIIWY